MSVDSENLTGNVSFDGDLTWTRHATVLSPNFILLGQYIILSMTAATSCLGILCSSFVFIAAWRVPSKTLKSKSFILNSVSGDIFLCIARTFPTIRNTVDVFSPGTLSGMLTVVGTLIGAASQYSQAIVSIPLALDRVYAVTRPMAYYTTGYNRVAIVVMVASPWLVSLALNLPTFILPFVGEQHDIIEPLHVKVDFAFNQFTKPLRTNFLIAVNVFVFLLYVTIFVVFIIQRKANRAVKNSSRDKTALSLTLTYFFTHLSSLCLYLPAPIYREIRRTDPTIASSKGVPAIINRGFVHMYILNTVVNALILGRRVPNIKENLKKILDMRFVKSDKVKVKKTEITKS